jgi:hypothetical protein
VLLISLVAVSTDSIRPSHWRGYFSKVVITVKGRESSRPEFRREKEKLETKTGPDSERKDENNFLSDLMILIQLIGFTFFL